MSKTINKIEVRNMESPSSGNPVPNQFVITTPDGQYFQSYRSVIAFIEYKTQKVYLGQNWDYSATTGKYRNRFLGEGIAETRKKIKNGTYKVVDL